MPSFAAFPGFFFAFAAMVLLVIVSVSVPIWDSVYFLKATLNSETVTFGNWGYCVQGGSCTSAKYGYDLTSTLISDSTGKLSNALSKGLTYVFILHPIAAGLSFIAALLGLIGTFASSRASTILMVIASLLALLVTGVAWIINMIAFGIARNRVRNAGGQASYENGEWILLGAFASLILASFFAVCGSFGRFRSDRGAGIPARY
ncbi:Actin cortical patch SUR7/pH-response regulator PalI [Phaffia rhodozyma]|uniref:Actin cortical patch SUR7/pH-response regulator PalI n=1 Tax=Phaffia rhodozyma TaxID=264483 RepID=A0A0F7SF29_PHARH|nr:Actin cortical patch SUR7/pH-response regulator PalI [Phaffia rhodozyma]